MCLENKMWYELDVTIQNLFSEKWYELSDVYLNNKDILKEIHKSKNTYCWFMTPGDADYDMIISDNKKITKKQNKNERTRTNKKNENK